MEGGGGESLNYVSYAESLKERVEAERRSRVYTLDNVAYNTSVFSEYFHVFRKLNVYSSLSSFIFSFIPCQTVFPKCSSSTSHNHVPLPFRLPLQVLKWSRNKISSCSLKNVSSKIDKLYLNVCKQA